MNYESAEKRSEIESSEPGETPLVSVIIPTYNRRSHVVEAVGSVLSQTLADFEVLVIDDGSTDRTDEAIRGIEDSRIRYFYKENGGVSSARNMGLDKVKGQYIAFLDSDDLYAPEYLEMMVAAMEDDPSYGVAYTAATNHHPSGEVEEYRAEACCSGWITREIFDYFFLFCQTTVIRRHLLENFFFDEQLDISEDVDFLLRLSCQSQFLYVPQPRVIRRVQIDSLSQQNGTNRKAEDKIRVLERFYQEMGGNRWLSERVALKRFSRQYRKMGRAYYKSGARKAALAMLKKSIQMNPYRFRNYYDFMAAYLKFTQKDSLPDWATPPPLDKPNRSNLYASV